MNREKHYKPDFLAKLDRTGLRRALWLLRRQDARPAEINPAAAQYDELATAAAVRAEYRRRGWKVPKPTRAERVERFS
jgi:hypothetical protein